MGLGGSLVVFLGPGGSGSVQGGFGRYKGGSRGVLEGPLETSIFFLLEVKLSTVE